MRRGEPLPGISNRLVPVDRDRVRIQAARTASPDNRAVAVGDAVVAGCERELAEARASAEAHRIDPPEMTGWSRSGGEA